MTGRCLGLQFGFISKWPTSIWICRFQIWISFMWMFPKIGVPPNHPILIGFPMINHPFWGPTPIFGNTHVFLLHPVLSKNNHSFQLSNFLGPQGWVPWCFSFFFNPFEYPLQTAPKDIALHIQPAYGDPCIVGSYTKMPILMKPPGWFLWISP